MIVSLKSDYGTTDEVKNIKYAVILSDDGEPVIIVGARGSSIFQLLKGDTEFNKVASILGYSVKRNQTIQVNI